MILTILGVVLMIGVGIFMHLLVKAICIKHRLIWPEEWSIIVRLYMIGVLPILLIIIGLKLSYLYPT